MFQPDGDDAEEEEDDAVWQGCHGLDRILDGGVALLGYVLVPEVVLLFCFVTDPLTK